MNVSKGLFLIAATIPSLAYAIPVLQVGAPNSTYVLTSNFPTETDTAISSSSTLLVGGVYRNGVVSLGGGLWSDFGWSSRDSFPLNFNGRGAILVAAVPQNSSGTLTVNGFMPFFTSGESMFPNNHDPIKSSISDFMYFDIGTFNNNELVTNFTEDEGTSIGEVKELLISTTGLPWVHFDVMAIETTNTKRGLLGTLVNNPGSHDATWKKPEETIHGVPSPGSPLLLGLGLFLISLGSIMKKTNPMEVKRKK